jgi:hypothetical protein
MYYLIKQSNSIRTNVIYLSIDVMFTRVHTNQENNPSRCGVLPHEHTSHIKYYQVIFV